MTTYIEWNNETRFNILELEAFIRENFVLRNSITRNALAILRAFFLFVIAVLGERKWKKIEEITKKN